MTILRKRITQDYTVLDNAVLRDKRLSYGAKGLFAYLWSMPDGWKFSVAHLATVSTNGRESTRKAMAELETSGHLRKLDVIDKGLLRVEWIITIPEPETGGIPVTGKPAHSDGETGGFPETGKPDPSKYLDLDLVQELTPARATAPNNLIRALADAFALLDQVQTFTPQRWGQFGKAARSLAEYWVTDGLSDEEVSARVLGATRRMRARYALGSEFELVKNWFQYDQPLGVIERTGVEGFGSYDDYLDSLG